MRVKDARIINLPDTLKKSNECPICGGAMRVQINLPRYPLTELYEPWAESFEEGRGYVDQAFLFCEPPCSHGKLETIVPPEILYGASYRTRTAASGGAMAAVHRFSAFVQSRLDMAQFDVAIDIGGNDGSLLGTIPGLRGVAIDPHAQGAGAIQAFIEDADLTPFKGQRKLILSSHTLEHIENPHAMLQKVAAVLHYGDAVALQFPSLDRLVGDCRLDHIHHQHIHYYSERSISLLLATYGIEIIASQFDHEHYGALMVLARKGRGESRGKMIHGAEVAEAANAFVEEITPPRIPEGSIAFGAALMLPVLAFWLEDLKNVEFIADNDKSKDGLRYVNFNRRISADYDLEGRDVVITGIATKAAGRALVAEAFAKKARNVIVPLHTL